MTRIGWFFLFLCGTPFAQTGGSGSQDTSRTAQLQSLYCTRDSVCLLFSTHPIFLQGSLDLSSGQLYLRMADGYDHAMLTLTRQQLDRETLSVMGTGTLFTARGVATGQVVSVQLTLSIDRASGTSTLVSGTVALNPAAAVPASESAGASPIK